MRNVTRAVALTAAALASAAAMAAGGSAHAACEPLLDSDFCTPAVDPDRFVPDRCWYDPQNHTITCEWD